METKQKYYLIMDSRANVDIDRALVIASVGEASKRQAKNYLFGNYKGYGHVLVAYDQGEDNTLINPEIVIRKS